VHLTVQLAIGNGNRNSQTVAGALPGVGSARPTRMSGAEALEQPSYGPIEGLD
jgi:hypothetical protein